VAPSVGQTSGVESSAIDIIPGAEPQSWSGGTDGVLVLHGFTGSPHSVRPWAEAIAGAGYTVELPLLPGHGTSLDDMMGTSWADWSAAADAAYRDLAARCERVAVAGLSMGGTLATWLALEHPEIVGVALVNPAVMPQPEIAEILLPMIEAGETVFAAIGSDIAKEGVVELAYEGTPLVPLQSLGEAIDALQERLPSLAPPVLLMTSPQDHVVPPASSDHLASVVSCPVERVTLERSYHVATLDHDAPLIQERTVEFLAKCFA
jgi:carboxylesterase